MNEKWNNGLDKIFRSSYSNDKYDYNKLLKDITYDYNKLLKDITYDDFLLREKAKVREEKIDLILKK